MTKCVNESAARVGGSDVSGNMFYMIQPLTRDLSPRFGSQGLNNMSLTVFYFPVRCE